jgi:hypothetical protein
MPLREIAELVERTFQKAAAAAEYSRPAWRCIEQRELLPLLAGVRLRGGRLTTIRGPGSCLDGASRSTLSAA